MKAQVDDPIVLLVDVPGETQRRVIPKGTRGYVVEAYTQPEEGYAVDVRLPDESLVGGFLFDNVMLYPDQFEVVPPESP